MQPLGHPRKPELSPWHIATPALRKQPGPVPELWYVRQTKPTGSRIVSTGRHEQYAGPMTRATRVIAFTRAMYSCIPQQPLGLQHQCDV